MNSYKISKTTPKFYGGFYDFQFIDEYFIYKNSFINLI